MEMYVGLSVMRYLKKRYKISENVNLKALALINKVRAPVDIN
jgi:hypothetical protein